MGINELRLLAGENTTENDGVLLLCMRMAEDSIKNYCNIEFIPRQLEITALKMAAEIYRHQYVDSEVNNGVSSIKIGDTQVSYNSEDNSDNGIIHKYKSQLNRCRRLSWEQDK